MSLIKIRIQKLFWQTQQSLITKRRIILYFPMHDVLIVGLLQVHNAIRKMSWWHVCVDFSTHHNIPTFPIEVSRWPPPINEYKLQYVYLCWKIVKSITSPFSCHENNLLFQSFCLLNLAIRNKSGIFSTMKINVLNEIFVFYVILFDSFSSLLFLRYLVP